MKKGIIKRLLSTEKSEKLRQQNTYVFEVERTANKIQIATAVEARFNVKVKRVNTLLVRGKVKRFGKFSGRTQMWKKAYVSINDGEELSWTE